MSADSDQQKSPKFTLNGLNDAPEIFAEGWTHLYFGFPLTKFVFHTITDPNPDNEGRKATLTLTLPMLTAIQLAQTILAAAKGNESLIENFASTQFGQIRQVLKELPEIKPPGPMPQNK